MSHRGVMCVKRGIATWSKLNSSGMDDFELTLRGMKRTMCLHTKRNPRSTDARLLTDKQLKLLENHRLRHKNLEGELENNKKSKEAESFAASVAKPAALSSGVTPKRNLSDVFQNSTTLPDQGNKKVKSNVVPDYPFLVIMTKL